METSRNLIKIAEIAYKEWIIDSWDRGETYTNIFEDLGEIHTDLILRLKSEMFSGDPKDQETIRSNF